MSDRSGAKACVNPPRKQSNDQCDDRHVHRRGEFGNDGKVRDDGYACEEHPIFNRKQSQELKEKEAEAARKAAERANAPPNYSSKVTGGENGSMVARAAGPEPGQPGGRGRWPPAPGVMAISSSIAGTAKTGPRRRMTPRRERAVSRRIRRVLEGEKVRGQAPRIAASRPGRHGSGSGQPG